MGFLGCASEDPGSRLRVRVTGAHDEPLKEARLRLEGEPVGRTDDEGVAWLVMRGKGGVRELTVDCPEGYRAPKARRLAVRRLGVRKLQLRCEPTHHHALLVVRAPGAEGLPVRVNGQGVGAVGADGTLHLDLKKPAGHELRVTVDTRQRPELVPRSPVVSTLLDGDEIVLFDRQFRKATPARPRSKHRKRAPPVSAPRRLRSL